MIGHVTKLEELDVRVFESRLSMLRHFASNAKTGIIDAIHSVLRITLRDSSVWVLDLAGAQHRQCKPLLPFPEYDRDYIAKILDIRAFGKSDINPERSILKRNPGNVINVMNLMANQEYQVDELVEWEHHNIAVRDLLKAKADKFERRKGDLVEHLATAAREFVKWTLNDPNSKARPMNMVSMTDEDENVSEEVKGRIERKRARKMASMNAETCELYEKTKAKGDAFVVI